MLLQAEFGHGVALSGVGMRQKLRAHLPENALGLRQNVLILLAAAGNIEQCKEDARGADAERIVEIPSTALAGKSGGDFRIPQKRKGRGDRLNRWRQFLFA